MLPVARIALRLLRSECCLELTLNLYFEFPFGKPPLLDNPTVAPTSDKIQIILRAPNQNKKVETALAKKN